MFDRRQFIGSATAVAGSCLVQRGHSDEVIRKVIGGNVMRVIEASS
jgi:hypothetical protein